jgi:tRNA(adenine34) deaminase
MTAAEDDNRWMGEALREARAAGEEDEVPVGALVVRAGAVLGRGRNAVERLHDPTAHAEILAITQAADATGAWRLAGATLYVTIEPCPMCAGAALLARVARIVYGAADPRLGACGSRFDLLSGEGLPAKIEVVGGVRAQECAAILTRFFRRRRSEKPLR